MLITRPVTKLRSYSVLMVIPLLAAWLQGCSAGAMNGGGGGADPDTVPPSAPTGLNATATSSTQTGLNWTASIDNVGVTGYRIERCSGAGCTSFAQIGTVAGATAFSDTSLTASTSYSYRARATDAAGNMGPYSNVSTAVTQGAADTQTPSAPANLVATAAASGTQIGLSWTASTDNVGVSGYNILRCTGAGCTTFSKIGTSTTPTYTDTGLTSATSYSYQVNATDAASNVSGNSNTASATTPDVVAPNAPTNLVATAAASGTQIGLTWTASTDNVGVTGYNILRCTGAGCTTFSKIGTSATTVYTDAGLTSATPYSYLVNATDAGGNVSGNSNKASATTPDVIAPTTPTALTATASSSSQAGLSWTGSTDNVGVTGYKIERCSGTGCSTFSQIGTTAGATTFSDSGLTSSTSYSYRLRATDAAGNLSGYSNVSSTTTTALGITVSVSPRRGGLITSQTVFITPTTNDLLGVNWSFTSTGSTSGGGFSASNSTTGNAVKFTAPTAAGVVTITATSASDASQKATATIGVTDLSGVTTYLNNSQRQGFNLQEYALATSGPTAVNATNFGLLYSCSVDAPIYSQPLWVGGLSISGVTHNVIVVATQHDSIYALDADDSSCNPLWKANLWDAAHGGAAGETWLSSSDVAGCGDIQPEIGIVGTPVIDLNSHTMYVVSKTKASGAIHQRLHSLDIQTGLENLAPATISGTVAGSGSGSAGGFVSFDPLANSERSALLLLNGHVIIAWASHCDFGPYHGWVMSYGAANLAQEAVLNLSPNGINSGVWMAGGGPAADGNGNIYIATGNGTFDVTNGSGPTNDYGDTILQLGQPSGGTLPIKSYFRSFQQQPSPDNADLDQGSGGVTVLPAAGGNNYLVQTGKDGLIYLMNQTGLGGSHSSSNSVVQEVSGQLPGGVWGTPTYWNGNLYFGAGQEGTASSDPLRAFSVNSSTGLMSSTPTSSSTHQFGFPGPTSSISSNGTSNGIVWSLDNAGYCTIQSPSCGPTILHAYDATNLANELWNSSGSAADAAGNAVKFTVPTVANGKVYVGTRGAASTNTGPGELDVYGLKP